MNLVCFPNLTAGGLVCNLLNSKYYPIRESAVYSPEHSVFKIDPEKNFETLREYNKELWGKVIHGVGKIEANKKLYFGTHCHPSVIQDLKKFDKVVCITVTSYKSKLYRFIRNYYVNKLFDKEENKLVELAKDILDVDFEPYETAINVEFEDIVNGKFVDNFNLNKEYFDIWKTHNNFLYNTDSFLTYCFDKAGEQHAIHKSN